MIGANCNYFEMAVIHKINYCNSMIFHLNFMHVWIGLEYGICSWKILQVRHNLHGFFKESRS